PLYVVALRPEDRAVVVGPREALLGRGLRATTVRWLVDPAPSVGAALQVRVRHRATPVPGTLLAIDGEAVEIVLEAPVHAIAPGQSAVFYDGEIVLGGGVIAAGRRTLPVRAA
ncbi:MAG: tRNA 2-thiouridine(34) synthase MnmA, partial [Gemmatimonadota bacterium]|nr:tRNA 2-thiouridine(34) synthase MnmA [Gemmatimonadota bacterium]